MKFTEREMTVAVEAVAQAAYEAVPSKPLRRKQQWSELPKLEKYHLRAAVGDTLLPALIALPDRPTIGAAPEFTDTEYAEAAAVAVPAELTGKKRAAMAASAQALLRIGVAAMPIRQDPDALIIPDHL